MVDTSTPSAPSAPIGAAAFSAAVADAAKREVDARSEAATSVGEAVKRFTDAVVAEVRQVRTTGPTPDLTATGTVGGQFVITGSGFGASGTVKLNGTQLSTTEWSTTRIVGKLPANMGPGELVVHVDEKTQRRGQLTV